jgi:ABC-type polysaccharide/polyol phosphate export permease
MDATVPQVAAQAQLSAFAKARVSAASLWDLLLALTSRDLRTRYQGTVFSFVWWIARPLAMGLVLYFALGRVLGLTIPHYGVFIMSGLFAWFWFSGAVTGAAGSIVANGGLIKKMQFPRIVLPLSAVLFHTAQFILTLPILTIFVLISGLEPSPVWLIGIPVLLVLQVLLLVGLGLLLAPLQVFFRDLGPMLEVTLLLMFYLTPIIYPLERVPDQFRPFVLINPAAPLVEDWRQLFVHNELPGTELWPAVVATAIVLTAGLFAFRKLEKYFADAL